MNFNDFTYEQLRDRRDDLTDEREGCIEAQRQASKRMLVIDAELKEVRRRIQASSSPLPRVSDHALLRYLERTMGLNLTQLRAEVLPQDLRTLNAIAFLGNGTYNAGSHRIVVKDRDVVTVLSLAA